MREEAWERFVDFLVVIGLWLLTSCSPLTCQTRLRVVRVDDVVVARCGTWWSRQYKCAVSKIVAKDGESRLLCDGSTMAIMPGDVTEVAP